MHQRARGRARRNLCYPRLYTILPLLASFSCWKITCHAARFFLVPGFGEKGNECS